VLARVEVDKKRRGDRVQFIFVPRLGEAVVQEIALDELRGQVTAALG
jgi:3-dehydroquinate synthetase